jgi:hypothetical protein
LVPECGAREKRANSATADMKRFRRITPLVTICLLVHSLALRYAAELRFPGACEGQIANHVG